jgi:hypothetical protein
MFVTGCVNDKGSVTAIKEYRTSSEESCISPNKHFVIKQNENFDYEFVDLKSNKSLGIIEPTVGRNRIHFTASWTPDSSKVALLMFYGTKLSTLLIYAKNANDTFQEISIQVPEPEMIYNQHTGKNLPRAGDGYDENQVGPWIDKDTVCLRSGEAIQTENQNEYLHIFVDFRARVLDGKAEISKLKLVGPLNNAESQLMLQK